MMQRMRRPPIVLLVAAALGLPGCGGSDGGSSEPTRAEFIAKTDAQCKVSNARTKALNEQVRRVADGTRDDARLLRELAPLLQRGYGQVRDNAAAFQAVNPPPADAAAVERIRKLYDEQAEIVRKLARAARRGELDAFRALSEEQRDVVVRARAAARAYGFKECGSTKSDAA
jgi:hypothetical protein